MIALLVHLSLKGREGIITFFAHIHATLIVSKLVNQM